MIPFWNFPTYSIGSLVLQTWGSFVASGIVVAVLIGRSRAKRAGISTNFIIDAAFWIVVAGFIGARLGHVFFYGGFLNDSSSRAIDILRVWEGGFSSFGGFLGAGIAAAVILRRHRNDLLRYADIFTSGMPIGWAIGRIGCFLIHDHPGTLTHFALGVRYPDGVRHDLGLYDSLQTFALAIVVWVFRKSLAKWPGGQTALIFVWYGIARFFLDFLRINDVRYGGLTPAQYGAVILALVGGYLGMRSLHGICKKHVVSS